MNQPQVYIGPLSLEPPHHLPPQSYILNLRSIKPLYISVCVAGVGFGGEGHLYVSNYWSLDDLFQRFCLRLKNLDYAQLRGKEDIYFCRLCGCFLLHLLLVYMCSYFPESELKLHVGIKQCYSQRQACQNLLKWFFKSYFLLHFVVIWDTLLNIYSHSIFQLCCSHITFIFLQIQTC